LTSEEEHALESGIRNSLLWFGIPTTTLEAGANISSFGVVLINNIHGYEYTTKKNTLISKALFTEMLSRVDRDGSAGAHTCH
jgi:hypothetical protein